MDSFRSPMVSKYKVQKAGEKKKKKRIVQADESKLVKYIYQPHIPTVGGLISMQVTSLGWMQQLGTGLAVHEERGR